MKIINKNINDLIAAEYNPRQLKKDQYEHIANSIKRFGIVDPIIINKNKDRKNIIIGGHQRVKVAKDLKINTIPCVEVDLTLDKEKELNVRLNKNTGEWNFDILADLFDMDNLIDWGFKEDELVGFAPEEEKEGLIDDDEIPDDVEPVCKLGDVWELGKHRLLCGDSTKKENLELLLNGNKADMVFTDPPYNALKSWKKDEAKTETRLNPNDWFKNDNMEWDEYWNFLNKHFSVNKADSLYVCCDFRIYGDLVNLLKAKGYELKHCIVWVKNVFGLGKRYRFKHEFVVYLTKSNPKFVGNNSQADVWNIDVDRNSDHKTPKPVELPLRAIKNTIKAGALCLDGFLGSGTTLIACEKTNRICYGMELDEHYCDVIINRWEQYTGNKAKLINNFHTK